jgi:hypothetical protein
MFLSANIISPKGALSTILQPNFPHLFWPTTVYDVKENHDVDAGREKHNKCSQFEVLCVFLSTLQFFHFLMIYV